MNNEATLERVTLTEDKVVVFNKQYEGTIGALKTLATQGNTSLLRMIVNSDPESSNIISYLRETSRKTFAKYLTGYYVENKTAKKELSSRER